MSHPLSPSKDEMTISMQEFTALQTQLVQLRQVQYEAKEREKKLKTELDKFRDEVASRDRELKKAQDIISKTKIKQDYANLQREYDALLRTLENVKKENEEQQKALRENLKTMYNTINQLQEEVDQKTKLWQAAQASLASVSQPAPASEPNSSESTASGPAVSEAQLKEKDEKIAQLEKLIEELNQKNASITAQLSDAEKKAQQAETELLHERQERKREHEQQSHTASELEKRFQSLSEEFEAHRKRSDELAAEHKKQFDQSTAALAAAQEAQRKAEEEAANAKKVAEIAAASAVTAAHDFPVNATPALPAYAPVSHAENKPAKTMEDKEHQTDIAASETAAALMSEKPLMEHKEVQATNEQPRHEEPAAQPAISTEFNAKLLVDALCELLTLEDIMRVDGLKSRISKAAEGDDHMQQLAAIFDQVAAVWKQTHERHIADLEKLRKQVQDKEAQYSVELAQLTEAKEQSREQAEQWRKQMEQQRVELSEALSTAHRQHEEVAANHANEVAALQKQVNNLIAAHKQEVETMSAHIADVTAQHKRELDELNSQLEMWKEKTRLKQSSLQEASDEATSIKERWAAFQKEKEDEIKALRTEVAKAKEETAKLREEAAKLKEENGKCKEENNKLKEENAKAIQEVSRKKEELALSGEERKRLMTTLSDKEKELAAARDRVATLEDRTKKLSAEATGLRESLAAAEKKQIELNDGLEQRAAQIRKLRSEAAQLRTELDAKEKALSAAGAERVAAAGEASDWKSKLDKALEQKKKLKDELATARAAAQSSQETTTKLIDEHQKTLALLRAAEAKAARAAEDAAAARAEIDKANAAADERVRTVRADGAKALAAAEEKLRAEISTRERLTASFEERLAAITAERDVAISAKDALAAELLRRTAELEASLKRAGERLDTAEKTIDELQRQKAAVESQLELARAESAAAADAAGAAERRATEVEAKMQALEEQRAKDKEDYATALAAAEAALAEAQERARQLEVEMADKEAERKVAERKSVQLIAELKSQVKLLQEQRSMASGGKVERSTSSTSVGSRKSAEMPTATAAATHSDKAPLSTTSSLPEGIGAHTATLQLPSSGGGGSQPGSRRGSFSEGSSNSSPYKHIKNPTVSQLQEENNVLAKRLGEAQAARFQLEERVRALERTHERLEQELKQKSEVIRLYAMEAKLSGRASAAMERDKLQRAQKAGVMANLFRKTLAGMAGNHEHQALTEEMAMKMEAVLQETLLKNIQLQTDIETIGQELEKVLKENKELKEKLKEFEE